MPAPIIVSRVRATLHRQGYQGFTQEQILEIANSLNIDINNPNPEDTKAVVAALKELNVNNSAIEAVPTEEAPINLSEEIDYEALASLPKVEGAITPAQKNEMVSFQAQVLGLTLTESDAQAISQEVNWQSTDTEEMTAEIKSLIIAFIRHRERQNQNQINLALAEIVDEANQSNRRVSESLSQGLQTIAKEMEVSRNHFKSSVRSALRHFAIPGSETYE